FNSKSLFPNCDCPVPPTFRGHSARPPFIPLPPQPLQLGDRRLAVVDLQPQHRVVVQPDAAVLLHDDQRRRLLPALVAAAGLTAFERSDETLGEPPFAL